MRHHKYHSSGSKLSDFILGAQDGLVNVLGVVLGVAAVSSDARIVIAGGLAAALAESVSMAAVAYTSTKARADYFSSEKKREEFEVETVPEIETQEVRDIYEKQGLTGELLSKMVAHTTADKKAWVDFMMKEELRLAPVPKKGALTSAVIVGLSAIIGSTIPLIGFFFFPINISIYIGIILAALFLFAMGVYQALTFFGSWWRRGVELTVIGLVSALAGYGIGLIFSLT